VFIVASKHVETNFHQPTQQGLCKKGECLMLLSTYSPYELESVGRCKLVVFLEGSLPEPLIILCPVILFKNPPSPPEKSGVERHSII
jgi:hypothetical protein